MACCKGFIGTRLWAVLAALFTIIESIAVVGWFLLRYVLSGKIHEAIEFKGMTYAAFVVYGALLTFSLLLVSGISRNCKRLFHPWMVVLVMVLLFDTGSISLLTTLHADIDETFESWEKCGIAFYTLRMAGNIFSIVCVQSYYRTLGTPKNSTTNGTTRHGSLSTYELSDLELPPPYSLNDPVANSSSPPPYTEAVSTISRLYNSYDVSNSHCCVINEEHGNENLAFSESTSDLHFAASVGTHSTAEQPTPSRPTSVPSVPVSPELTRNIKDTGAVS